MGARENRLAVHDALWEADRKHGIIDWGGFTMNVMRLEKGFEETCGLIDELPEAGVPGFVELGVLQVLAGPADDPDNLRARKDP